jgi:uncharacterized membrane protein
MHYLLPFFKWCDATWLGETIRSSRIYFPIIETFHLLALTILFGAVLVLNLRLCRIMMQHQPVKQVAGDLSSWALWSLAVILVSGVMLFASEAMKCYASKPFQVKITFLFAALIFHFTIHRKVTQFKRDPSLIAGIVVGGLNVFLWLGVGLGGRAIGFL